MSNGKKASPKRTSGAGRIVGELSANQLSKPCEPDRLSSSTTSDLPGLQGVIGQPRAFRALGLGSEIDRIEYNIFVLGIPDANRCNLMLKEEVRAAVAAGKFHIWTVATIADAVQLLTGREFGEQQSDGAYPEGTFNRAVVAALESYAEIMHRSAVQKRRRGKPAAGGASSNEVDR